PPLRGGIHVDDVDTGSIAGNHPAACKRINGSRTNGGVLSKYSIGIASLLDDFIFSFALRGDKLKPRLFDNPPLDVYVAKVVVCDQYCLLLVCGFVWLHMALLVSRLVGVTRDSLYVRYILVFQCEFHAAAGVELTDRGTIDFLPRCLVVKGVSR